MMMSETLMLASAVLIGLVILSATTLRGWESWIALKRQEMERRGGSASAPEIEGGAPEGAARIEIADLKERIRRLEAIASGVDL
ncbi:hypothetical protein GCM10010923_16770 [Blastomonas marina]|jgi:hypothetical protein|uniref:Uncharacterized protein n=1 Tax=Blastomonas marina TaxID=1867408 RepID=A0ABQ1FF08_9SPHN|nr:hypothetical protein GCM10010923_16770 [Blastomonas marina]